MDQFELQMISPHTCRTLAHKLGVAQWEAWRPGGVHVACLTDANTALSAVWVDFGKEIGVQLVDENGTVRAEATRHLPGGRVTHDER